MYMYMYMCMYGLYKKGLHHSPSKFSKWVTEVCKIKWLGKEESHSGCGFAKKLFACYCFFFWQDFEEKAWERLKTRLGESTILSSGRDLVWHLYIVLSNKTSVFHLLRRWLPSAHAFYKPQVCKILLCKSVVGQEPETLLFCALETFPALFLGSSTRSLPLSGIFFHNSLKELCLVCLATLQW